MSPHNCKHTIKDIYRIKGYARGIDQAIRGMLKNKAQITVLYPACGLSHLYYYRYSVTTKNTAFFPVTK